MGKKALLLLGVFLVLTLLLPTIGCASPAPAPAVKPVPAPTSTPAKQIKLRFQTADPGTSVVGDGIRWWASEVEKRTNNAVKIEVIWGGVIASAMEFPNSMKSGTTDLGHAYFTYYPKLFTILGIGSSPVAFTTTYPVNPIADWQAVAKLRKEFTVIDDEFAKQNLKLVSELWGLEPMGAVTRKPVRSIDDFKGKKIRSGPTAGDQWKAVGAVPAFIPVTETFDSLDKGVVDGSQASMDHMMRFKFYEVAKYYTSGITLPVHSANGIVMNLDSWKALPADIQQVMLSVGDTSFLDMLSKMLYQSSIKGKEVLKKAGVEVIPFPPEDMEKWQKSPSLADSAEQWIKDQVKAGVPEATVRAIVKRYLEMEKELTAKYPEKW